jgi:hypothetical protein
MVIAQTAFITSTNRPPVSVSFRTVMNWCTVVRRVTTEQSVINSPGLDSVSFPIRLLGAGVSGVATEVAVCSVAAMWETRLDIRLCNWGLMWRETRQVNEWLRFVARWSNTFRRTDSSLNLPVAVAVLPERGVEILQLTMQALLSIQLSIATTVDW